MDFARWELENYYLKKAGQGLMLIVDTEYIQNRFNLIANNPVRVLPISESPNDLLKSLCGQVKT
jgi:hypothetical protein